MRNSDSAPERFDLGPQSATLREAYSQASSFLREAGVEEAGSSAELLLQHLVGCNRTALLFRFTDPFPVERREEWRALLERRAAGEPVQYIIGDQEFYGLTFEVTPSVLIPRPETELLVEAIEARGRELWPASDASPLCADIGTGSGAIAVTLAVRCPGWRLAAVDLSAEALATARRNAERNGAAERVRFVQGDLLEPLLAERASPDILVSNPPYIRDADIPGLQREVRLFEPHLALAGGEDGLDCYRRMVEQLSQLPAPPALVGFEVGFGQAQDVAELLRLAGHWEHIDLVRDLAGIERHVLAWRDPRS